MTRACPPVTLLILLFLLNACSLVQQDQLNDVPKIKEAALICPNADGGLDTLGTGQTCQMRRGAEVELLAFATDEDDDPLFYTWTAFGAGSFRDSLASRTSWFAPDIIQGNSEIFIVQVQITDRNCGAVLLAEDRRRCLEESEFQMASFLAEVVQRAPVVSTPSDTSVFFSSPFVAIDLIASDPDGDALVYEWEQLEGESEISIANDEIRDEISGEILGSRGTFIPFFPGSFRLRVSVNDGQNEVIREIGVEVLAEEPPAGGMVQLGIELLDGSTRSYEIDVYEYPNIRGEKPQLVANWFDAAVLCAAQGKRLCQPAEWTNACQGENQRLYSSTDDPANLVGVSNFGRRYCNTDGSDFSFFDVENIAENEIAPAGSFLNCQPGNGVYDLTGNVREWTGRIDPFGNSEASSSFSSIVLGPTDADCGFIRRLDLPFFQGVDFDFSDAAAIQQFVDALGNIERGDLEQAITGFRCCR